MDSPDCPGMTGISRRRDFFGLRKPATGKRTAGTWSHTKSLAKPTCQCCEAGRVSKLLSLTWLL